MARVIRRSTESTITVVLEPGPISPGYRDAINTKIVFLNHMIEHMVWRSGINISVDAALGRFDLSHVICEDTGITLGKAALKYLSETGGAGFGDGVGIIDEAIALSAVSFEGRAHFSFDDGGAKLPEMTEGMVTEDLPVFLEGMAQGGGITIHLHILKGKNSHHIWEAAFRAVGTALGRALAPELGRGGLTAGVAGQIEFEVGE